MKNWMWKDVEGCGRFSLKPAAGSKFVVRIALDWSGLVWNGLDDEDEDEAEGRGQRAEVRGQRAEGRGHRGRLSRMFLPPARGIQSATSATNS